MSFRLVLLVSVSVLMLLCSCGSHGDTPLGDLTEPETTVADQLAGMPNLGSLDSLPAAKHGISLAGPGWYEVDLIASLATAGEVSPHDDTVMPLVSLSQPAYALYGVEGFDGDNFPTSARVSASDISGEYYVGFSDYTTGTWAFSGPFTGAATAEIPNDDNYSNPKANTSPNNTCYFMVVVPDGGSITITHLELGVHGGTLGPAAPLPWGSSSSSAAIQIGWQASTDYQDPDFAGYIVERAPRFEGDFAPLFTAPIPETYYLDYDIEVGYPYRYRVAALDVCGNLNYSYSFMITADGAGTLYPVAVVDYPAGPLTGPVYVTFDMSDSFDPEGDPIDEYGLYFWGGFAEATGTSPSMTFELQPGCYSFTASVKCGSRVNSTNGHLKVYPAWGDPVLVKQEPPNMTRGGWVSTGILPTTGQLVHGSTENVAESFEFTVEEGTGSLEIFPYWLADSPASFHNPVILGDYLVFQAQNNYYVYTFAFNGEETMHINALASTHQSVPGLASDGDHRLWSVVCNYDATKYHLQVRDLISSTDVHLAAENTGNISWIDAAYNPGVDALDIVYTLDSTLEMYWVRDDLSGTPATPVEINPGAMGLAPRLIVNPANDRPLIAFMEGASGLVKFTALQSDLATWTTPEDVDNSMGNGNYFSLALDDGYPIVMLPLVDGSINIYRRASGWQKTNTLPSVFSSFLLGSLIPNPDGPGVIATCRVSDYSLTSYLCEYDGTNTLRFTQPGMAPLGVGLQGAAHDNELHAVYLDSSVSTVHMSSPDGVTWTDLGTVTGARSANLVTEYTGELYMSYYDTNYAYLDWWDGANWNNVDSIPTTEEHMPITVGSWGTDDVYFGCYNTTTNLMEYMTCDHDDATVSHSIDHGNDVWGGITSGYGGLSYVNIGPAPTNSTCIEVAWGQTSGTSFLYGTGRLMMRTDWYVKGRTMGSAIYTTRSIMSDTNVYWLGSSGDEKVVRVTDPGYSPPTIEYLTLVDPLDDSEPRRTVSAVTTDNRTAVALMCNLSGEYTCMEWSNYGEWEELPVPGGAQNMMGPELICGDDGRWHIIYRDWVLDRIMCVSTL